MEASTLDHSTPSGSTVFRRWTASGMGTCVNWLFQNPTIRLVRPVMAACTALWPSSRQNAESWALAGTLRMV